MLDALAGDDLGDALDGVYPIAMDRFDRVGGDADGIGGGEADTGVAMVYCENGVHRKAGWGVGNAEVLQQLLGQFLDDFFDAVRLVAVGDEEAVFGLDDDEIVDAEEGDAAAVLVAEDDVVFAVDGSDLLVGLVVVRNGVEVFGDGDPRSDIVPIEGGFDVEDAGSVLHESVVDGGGGEFRELCGDGRGDIFGGAEFLGKLTELRGVAVEFGEDGGDGPDEHTGIPAEAAGVDELFGEFGVWFFAEADDVVGDIADLDAGEDGAVAAFHVAVGGAGPGGADADGDEGVGGRSDRDRVFHDGLEGRGVLDELVGGEDDHGRLGISSGDEADPEGDGGGGVTFGGLGDDVFGGKGGGDFADAGFLEGVGEDEDVLGRDDAVEALDGLGEQGGPVEEVEKLLGLGISAEGPESGAAAASEDYCVCFGHVGGSWGLQPACQKSLSDEILVL